MNVRIETGIATQLNNHVTVRPTPYQNTGRAGRVWTANLDRTFVGQPLGAAHHENLFRKQDLAGLVSTTNGILRQPDPSHRTSQFYKYQAMDMHSSILSRSTCLKPQRPTADHSRYASRRSSPRRRDRPAVFHRPLLHVLW